MSVVSVIGTIVFLAVVALALMAVIDVIFSRRSRSGDKVYATTRKPCALARWLAKAVMFARKRAARRQESRPGGK